MKKMAGSNKTASSWNWHRSNCLLAILWSIIVGVVIIFIISPENSLTTNNGIDGFYNNEEINLNDKCSEYIGTGDHIQKNSFMKQSHQIDYLPSIIIISFSPFSNLETLIISLRSIVLNSDLNLIHNIIILDGTGVIEDEINNKYKEDWNELNEILEISLNQINIEIYGNSISNNIRFDEISFKASIEPKLYEIAKLKPYVFIWLDSGCIVEPFWLKPLIEAITFDPYLTAVPNINHNQEGNGNENVHERKVNNDFKNNRKTEEEDEESNKLFLENIPENAIYDWDLNYHETSEDIDLLKENKIIMNYDNKLNNRKHQFYYNPKTKLSSLSPLLSFAVHSDWWKAIGGFEASKEVGLNTGIWPSTIPIQPSFRSQYINDKNVNYQKTSTKMLRSSDIPMNEFDKMPYKLSGSGASSLELSLRMWCCGGGIQRIHCSNMEHITTTYDISSIDNNLKRVDKVIKDKPLKDMQLATHRQALYTAELWLGKYAYKVRKAIYQISSSSPSSPSSAQASGLLEESVLSRISSLRIQYGVNKQCHDINWYLKNINPNLFYPLENENMESSKGNHGMKETSLSETSSSEITVERGSSGILIEEPWVDFQDKMNQANIPTVPDSVDVHLVHNLAIESSSSSSSSSSSFPPSLDHKYCNVKDNDSELLKHVQVATQVEVEDAENRAVETGMVNHRSRLMCIIYCTRSRHGDAVQVVKNTWASKCDGFIAMSDLTEMDIPTLNVPHQGKEEYDNIWQKVRSIWLMVYQRYYNDFDWFIIGGDDLYLIVENLRLYLHSKEILEASSTLQEDGKTRVSEPLFLGRRFKANGEENRMFNSGGAGYMLNQNALKILAYNAIDNIKCQPNLKGFWEDVQVASCLRKVGNTNINLNNNNHNKFIYNENNINSIVPYDTKDEFGKERFHPFTPGNHLIYKIPNSDKGKLQDWYYKYSIDLKQGLECCSEFSVSFHYVKPLLMPKIHALLYDCRDKK